MELASPFKLRRHPLRGRGDESKNKRMAGAFPATVAMPFSRRFRVQVAPDSDRIFGRDGHNFSGARIAPVAFLPARLLLRRHSRKQPGNGIFAVGKLVRQNRRFGA
jgi:hypothetical protein